MCMYVFKSLHVIAYDMWHIVIIDPLSVETMMALDLEQCPSSQGEGDGAGPVRRSALQISNSVA